MWGFGTIVNDSGQTLMFDYAVGAGSSSAADLNGTRGNAILEIGSLGAIYFTDVGWDKSHWAVDIQCGGDTWRWFYDGAGVLDVSVATDGSCTLSGQGQSHTMRLSAAAGPAVPPPVAAVAAISDNSVRTTPPG